MKQLIRTQPRLWNLKPTKKIERFENIYIETSVGKLLIERRAIDPIIKRLPMRRILLLILLIPALSFAQSKGDNVIISKDTSATLAKFRTAFMNEGFVIDKDNADYLTTELLSKSWYGMKYTASKDGDSIILKGYIRIDLTLSGVRNDNLIQADYKGMKGSANKVAFEKLYGLVGKVSKEYYSAKK